MKGFYSLRKVNKELFKRGNSHVLPFVFASNKWGNEIVERRNYHVTVPNNSLVLIGTGMLVTAAVVHVGLGLKNNISASSDEKKSATASNTENLNTNSSKVNAGESTTSTSNSDTNTEKSKANTANTSKAETKGGGWSFFSSDWLARTFYDGGFEEKMSKREAALILGVRESATQERIKDCHRKILLLNHPDRGGSAYMAAKINEAKDVLLKGK